jgi:predicted DNA-binding transcriptional regulator AlpA
MGTPSKRSRNSKRRSYSTRPHEGTDVIWLKGLEKRLGITDDTRTRWEKSGKLPPRDAYIGGVAVGWRPATIEAWLRGPVVRPATAAPANRRQRQPAAAP